MPTRGAGRAGGIKEKSNYGTAPGRFNREGGQDAHGNVLADGDCVLIIKDLKLGGSSVLKGGSKSKPIRLGDGDHEIDCKVDGVAVMLKACFVRPA